ncbi:MAG: ATP phosphoribosyltransferase regulatory subunit, partial [Polyangiaceae bacterium]|nr:ATP phosphoribosyltransferase regulatory subunit [Polyangiaceae bacterium]
MRGLDISTARAAASTFVAVWVQIGHNGVVWHGHAFQTLTISFPKSISSTPMIFRAVKGMNDILPDETSRWQQLERAFTTMAQRHCYEEVRTPIVEPTPLFTRSIGETTDVVEKEMYSFIHHDDPLTIRPEGTASAVRAYVEHHVNQKEPVTRWYYVG